MTHRAKRLLALLVAVVVWAGLMFEVAMAENIGTVPQTPTLTTTLYLGEDDVGQSFDKLETEGWKWEPASDGTSGTLTLEDCYIKVLSGEAIHIWGSIAVTIVLNGSNIIEDAGNGFHSMLLGYSVSDCIVKAGSEGGSLDIRYTGTEKSANQPYAFGCSNLTIESGNITCNTNFFSSDNFEMTGGSLTIDTGDVSELYAITAYESLSITNSKLNAVVAGADTYAIGCGGDILISDNSTITAKSANSSAIFVSEGSSITVTPPTGRLMYVKTSPNQDGSGETHYAGSPYSETQIFASTAFEGYPYVHIGPQDIITPPTTPPGGDTPTTPEGGTGVPLPEEEIPIIYPPKTGDNTPILFYLGALLVSGVGIVVLTIHTRKRRENR